MGTEISDAWNLLDRMRNNAENWYLCSKEKSKVDPVYDSIKSFLRTSKVKDLCRELNIGTDPMLHVLKDFSKFLNLPEKYLKFSRESKAIRMVEALKKKTTPPERRKEAYRKPNGKKLEGTPIEKGKKNNKMEQCGTPPYVNIIKEIATPIPVVNKEVYLDRDTTSYLKGCTEGKNAGKQILSCSFGCKIYFGLCDPGSPINIITYSLYAKIYDEVAPCTLEPTDVIIKLADKTDRKPCGVIKDVSIIIGSLIYTLIFMY